jgi:hypothetical protein
MDWDVKTVNALSGCRLYVELKNGQRGIFDVSPHVERGVLRELKEPAYFNQVAVFAGAVTWPHGQDIAPETLLQGLCLAEKMP